MEQERDYALLYREIAPQLWRAIYAYSGGRRDVADDAVGEAFVRAIESDGRIRRPFPWLYRTAFRIAAADLRQMGETGATEQIHLDDPATGDLMRACDVSHRPNAPPCSSITRRTSRFVRSPDSWALRPAP